MEGTGEFIGLIVVASILVIILNIILFFKVWGMTNDVSAIKEILQEWIDIEHPIIMDIRVPKEKHEKSR